MAEVLRVHQLQNDAWIWWALFKRRSTDSTNSVDNGIKIRSEKPETRFILLLRQTCNDRGSCCHKITVKLGAGTRKKASENVCMKFLHLDEGAAARTTQ